MDLHHIKSFVEVVRANGFTRAAESLHLTQPALTNQIRSLEEEVSAILLERTRRGVHLTPAGEIFYAYALSVLELREDLRSRMAALKGVREGRVRVGVEECLIPYLLSERLRKFKIMYPSVSTSLTVALTSELQELLRRRDLDIIIFVGDREENQEAQTVLESNLIFLANRYLPVAESSRVSVEELKNYNFILSKEGSLLRKAQEDFLARMGLTSFGVTEATDFEIQKRLVEYGLGVGIIPEFALPEGESEAIVRLRVVFQLPRLQVLLTSRKRELLSPACHRFIELF